MTSENRTECIVHGIGRKDTIDEEQKIEEQ